MNKKHVILLIILLFGIIQIKSQNTNFDSGWGDWYADNGTWEVGIPTAGPDSAYSPDNCVGTSLSGNYTPTTHSRLISPYFTVPDASDNPRLEFMSWQSLSSSDYGYIQIKGKDSSTWENISEKIERAGSNSWSKGQVMLDKYAGQEVQVAFYFSATDDGSYGSDNSTGWYIDDIFLKTGSIEFPNPQNWESGWADWYADNGTWEVGISTAGPDSAYSPDNCVGTSLSGNYTPTTHSRLISPYFTVPDASENPKLEFYHWFSFSSSDYGNVQVRIKDSIDWHVKSTDFTQTTSNAWTRYLLHLDEYANQTIQIAFNFSSTDDGSYGSDNSTGWYIDSITFIGIPEQNVLYAGFTADVLTGYAALSVNFTDQSMPVGNISSWQWDFDNDGTIDSEEQNPSYVYNSPGSYDVKLIVSDGIDSDTLIKSQYIEVETPVEADFMANITSGEKPFTVAFEDLSVPSGTINSWKWDFDNDGTIDSEEQNPTFVFDVAGIYSVKLIAGDGIMTDEIVKSEYIEVTEPGNTDKLSIEEVSMLEAYPNPFTNELRLSGEILLDAQVEVYGISGMLYCHEVSKSDQLTLNLSELNPGIYLIFISSETKNAVLKVGKQ